MIDGVHGRFPYRAFKGFEGVQVESMLNRTVHAYETCMREGGYGEDQEQLIDDMYDIIKPSEDEEMLLLHVIDAFFSLIDG